MGTSYSFLEVFESKYKNKKYGILTIKDYMGKNTHGKNIIRCICDCGNETIVTTSNLYSPSSKTTSCGCNKEKRNKLAFEKDIKDVAIGKILLGYKKSATERNIKFELNDQEFVDLILREQCFYCESKSGKNIFTSCNKPTRSFEYFGIDRVNNNIGYCNSNTVTSCRQCNFSKNNFSSEKIINICSKIQNNMLQIQNFDFNSVRNNILTNKEINPDVILVHKLYLKYTVGNQLYIKYKSRSLKEQIKFEIDRNIFRGLIYENCYYCNEPSSSIFRLRSYTTLYNGIDKMTPGFGYVDNNIIPCCFTCNRFKYNRTKEQFLNFILKIQNKFNK